MHTDPLAQSLTVARLRRGLPPPVERRLIRERAGISQTALAAAFGVNPATVSRWESGDRQPSAEHLKAYTETLERLERETR